MEAPKLRSLRPMYGLVDESKSGKFGLLFVIPGVDKTLWMVGWVRLAGDAASIAPFAADSRVRLSIAVTVVDAYLHCAKALMRSELWHPEIWVDRSSLPSTVEMLSDQTGSQLPLESPAEMLARYAADI